MRSPPRDPNASATHDPAIDRTRRCREKLEWLESHGAIVAFAIGTVNATVGSAAQIVLTQIVPRERLVEAHAKNALASSAAEVAGPGAAGALIRITGAPVALLADAAMLLTSASILRGVTVKETPGATNAEFWPAMREGLHFVRSHRLLVTMASCVGIWQLCNQAAMAYPRVCFRRQKPAPSSIEERRRSTDYNGHAFSTVSLMLKGRAYFVARSVE